jgi:hypothetical protein
MPSRNGKETEGHASHAVAADGKTVKRSCRKPTIPTRPNSRRTSPVWLVKEDDAADRRPVSLFKRRAEIVMMWHSAPLYMSFN